MVHFKGEEIKLSGNPPAVGSAAPNFELLQTDLSPISLETLKKGRTVLYVVPSLDTSVCIRSSQSLAGIAKTKPQTAFCVISCDLPFAMKRHESTLPGLHLLSLMRSRAFGKEYGIFQTSGPLEGLLARALFVLDGKSKVIYSEIVEEVTCEPVFDKILPHLL